MEHGRSPQSQPPAVEQRLAELEALVRQQQATIAEQQATIAAYQEQLSHAAEQIKLLRKALFSSRRERYAPSADQTLLFAAESVPAPEEEDDDSEDDEPPPADPRSARRHPRRIMFPQFLPRH